MKLLVGLVLTWNGRTRQRVGIVVGGETRSTGGGRVTTNDTSRSDFRLAAAR